MLLANQRLRERSYEDRDLSKPTAEESASAIRGVQPGQGGAAKGKREPTLLNVAATERRAREATLVGVGLATPSPMASRSAQEVTVKSHSSTENDDRSTDETLPRIEQTCEVSLGEMEVLGAQREAQAADSTDHLPREADELEDTQGEWIRFEKSFANTTIAAIFCAILAFFLLPSGHDAPVPPRLLKNAPKAAPVAAAAPAASPAAATVESPSGVLVPAGSEASEQSETDTALDAASTTSAKEHGVQKPRARTPQERKELRKKRREARAKREAVAKRDATEKRESTDKRRKAVTESMSKKVRLGGKS
jgi:hypothetical protein